MADSRPAQGVAPIDELASFIELQTTLAGAPDVPNGATIEASQGACPSHAGQDRYDPRLRQDLSTT